MKKIGSYIKNCTVSIWLVLRFVSFVMALLYRQDVKKKSV